MDCERFRRLIALAIGGDASPATRAAVEAHAAACASCRADYVRYRAAREALASAREAPEPPGGWAGIWAGIAEHLAPSEVEETDNVQGPMSNVQRPRSPVQRPMAVPALGPRTSDLGPRTSDLGPRTGDPSRYARLAAGLLVGFSVGFTAYHVGFKSEPGSGTPAVAAGHVMPTEFDSMPVTTAPPGPAVALEAGPSTGLRASPSTELRASWVARIGALLGRHPQGWSVREIVPGGPAAASGLLLDDAVQAVNGAALPRSADEMDALMIRHLELPELRLKILRDGAEREVVLKLR